MPKKNTGSGTRLLVKLNFLLLGLALALYFIHYLNHRNMEPAYKRLGLVPAARRKAHLIMKKPGGPAHPAVDKPVQSQ